MISRWIISWRFLRRLTPFQLNIIDNFLALFVFFPGLVFYWRGSWDLIGVYTYPWDQPESRAQYWVMTAVGTFCLPTYFLLPFLNLRLGEARPPNVSWTYYIITRLLLSWHAILYMFWWRGLWGLYNSYLGTDLNESAIELVEGMLTLMCLGGMRTALWPPIFVLLDRRHDLLHNLNRFTKSEGKGIWWVLDCIFTCYILHALAVFCWRSATNVWDGLLPLFPQHPADLWDLTCFIAGFILINLIFLSQRLLQWISIQLFNRYGYWAKLVYEDFAYGVIFVVLTLTWRGAWNMLVRALPDPVIGGWICHLTGGTIFLFTEVYSTVAAWTCVLDGVESDGQAFFFNRYLEALVQLGREDDLLNLVPELDVETDNDITQMEIPISNHGNIQDTSSILQDVAKSLLIEVDQSLNNSISSQEK